MGPLGNGFPLDAVKGKKVFLMGGGIGIPPMLETAKQLDAEKIMVLGYRSVFTYSLVMDMRMRIHIFGFAHTGKTRAYATGHTLFHGDPARR